MRKFGPCSEDPIVIEYLEAMVVGF